MARFIFWLSMGFLSTARLFGQVIVNGNFQGISTTCSQTIVNNNGFASTIASHIHANCLTTSNPNFPDRWRVSHGSPEIRSENDVNQVGGLNYFISTWSGKAKDIPGNVSNTEILSEGIMYELCYENYGNFILSFRMRTQHKMSKILFLVTAGKSPTASVNLNSFTKSEYLTPSWNSLPNTYLFHEFKDFNQQSWTAYSIPVSLPVMNSSAPRYLWIFPYDEDDLNSNFFNIDDLILSDDCPSERLLTNNPINLPRYSASDHIIVEGDVTINPSALPNPFSYPQEMKAGNYIRFKPGLHAYPDFNAYIGQCPPQSPTNSGCYPSWRMAVNPANIPQNNGQVDVQVFPNPLTSGQTLHIKTNQYFKGEYQMRLMAPDGKILLGCKVIGPYMEIEMAQYNFLQKFMILQLSDDEKSYYQKVVFMP